MKSRTLGTITLFLVLALILAFSPALSVITSAYGAIEQATPAPTTTGDNQPRLILATTTSTQDSGLLDVLIPIFEERFNAEVDVIAVGTGQALELGTRGDADVVLVHARAREDEFVAAGDGTARYDVMYNDFVIVGPTDDPAGIKAMTSAVEAFKRISEKKVTFISRGDDSGTHTKELSIWKEANIKPEGSWYLAIGQGMGATLNMAGEQKAYTLSDRATYAARKVQGLDLVILVEGDKTLLNPYGVIPVNPAKHPNVNNALAMEFVSWITSLETQQMIAAYKIAGEQVFFPDSAQYREAMQSATATPAPTLAATP